MPPRYAYWTIVVDDQPTAFRSGDLEDLMPTFNRLKEKHPGATLMWFQNGKLWKSQLDAREAMQARGEQGRRRDPRQGGLRDELEPARGFKSQVSSPKPQAPSPKPERGPKPEWKPRSTTGGFKTQAPSPRPERGPKPEWKPKADARNVKPQAASRKPEWTSRPERGPRPEWKPKGATSGFNPQAASRRPEGGPRPEWKPKGATNGFKPSAAGRRPEGGPKPEWKPKGAGGGFKPQAASPRPERGPKPTRESRPPATAEKPDARRGKNWRPGGEHKDPRQKYKDAKKAKWTRFKKAIRTRHDKRANSDKGEK